MRKYNQQYIKENGFDDYVMEQAMLNSGPGSVKMIPGLLPPPPMPPLPDIDLDADIGYKNLPPLPPLNGKLGYAGSTCGSDDDFKTFDTFDTCELHGEIRYPPGSNECPEIYRALDGVRFIAESTKREEESCKVQLPKYLYPNPLYIKVFLSQLSTYYSNNGLINRKTFKNNMWL